MPSITQDFAYLTADMPGTGGVIKLRPEDFLVEEQPLYEPVGHGEHLYLYVEKTNTTTTDVVRRLAKMFRVPRWAIGYAGLKDKHAVARQHFSVHLPDPSNDKKFLDRMQYTHHKLLWAERHTNKIDRGHHAGNRFVIRIRQVDPTSVVRAKQVLDHLQKYGVPNFIGDQRFGYRQNNHILGKLLLLQRWQPMLDEMLGNPIEQDSPGVRAGREAYDRRDYQAALQSWPRHLRHDRQALDALRQGRTAEQAVMAIDSQQRSFLINSMQSAMFNQVLDQRVREGTIGTLLPGDLAWKHDSRAVFAVDEQTAAIENAPDGRVASLQVSPSGPMWGSNMTQAAGRPGEMERRVLEQYELSEQAFAASKHSTSGSRRSMRLVLKDQDISGGVDEHGPYIRIAFELQRGSFATVVLREIMKCDTRRPSPVWENDV